MRGVVSTPLHLRRRLSRGACRQPHLRNCGILSCAGLKTAPFAIGRSHRGNPFQLKGTKLPSVTCVLHWAWGLSMATLSFTVARHNLCAGPSTVPVSFLRRNACTLHLRVRDRPNGVYHVLCTFRRRSSDYECAVTSGELAVTRGELQRPSDQRQLRCRHQLGPV